MPDQHRSYGAIIYCRLLTMVVSSSQPVSSQPGEMEAHFAALLEPIRDMAKNWDIDIAHHLEEYLEEVYT